MSGNNNSKNTLEQAIRAIVLAEITRYKKETGTTAPRWEDRFYGYMDKGLYVTFSIIPKLGVNPVNTWETPTGIYSYELASNRIAEFATDRPYAVVFKTKPGARVLRLSKYSEEQLVADWKRLRVWLITQGIEYDEDDLQILSLGADAVAKKKILRGPVDASTRIWFLTRNMAKLVFGKVVTKLRSSGGEGKPVYSFDDVAPHDMEQRQKIHLSAVNVWAKVLNQGLGYDGVVDDTGRGIIFDAEPNQAVFFSSSVVEPVDIITKPKGYMKTYTPETYGLIATGQKVMYDILNGKKDFSGLMIGSFAGSGNMPNKLIKLVNPKLVHLNFSNATFKRGVLPSNVSFNRCSFNGATFDSLDMLSIVRGCDFDNIKVEPELMGRTFGLLFSGPGNSMNNASLKDTGFIPTFDGVGMVLNGLSMERARFAPRGEKLTVRDSAFLAVTITTHWSQGGVEFEGCQFKNCDVRLPTKNNKEVAYKNCVFNKCLFEQGGDGILTSFMVANFEGCKFVECNLPTMVIEELKAKNSIEQ